MKEQWFEVKNLDDFVDSTRKMIFHFFGKLDTDKINNNIKEIWQMSEEELQELNSTLSLDECMVIVKNQLKVERGVIDNKYYVSDNIFMTIVEEINSRLVSNILTKLASKGLIETAFDDKANDFIFWCPSESEEDELSDEDSNDTKE